jgi:hypothetical protein
MRICFGLPERHGQHVVDIRASNFAEDRRPSAFLRGEKNSISSRGEIGLDLRFADPFRQALELPHPSGEIFKLGLRDLVAGVVAGLDVGPPQEVETLLLLRRGLRKDRQKRRIVAGGQVTELLQVMDLRFVIGEDQQHGGVETLDSLMKAEGGLHVRAVIHRVLVLPVCVFRVREPPIEVCSGEPPAFSRVELAGAGEFEFAGIVKQDAFFLDVAEEVLAAGQGLVDPLDRFDDQVRPGRHQPVGPGLGMAPGVGAVGDLVGPDDDQDVEVRQVLVQDPVLDMPVLDPVAAGVGAEQNDHQDGRTLGENDLGDALELIAFVLGQMA